MTIENATEQVLQIISVLRQDPLDAEVRETLSICVADYLGVTFAGARELRTQLAAYASGAAVGAGGIPVLGYGGNFLPAQAALLNGCAAHVLELDDGSRFGMVHPGAPVLSALFPVAMQNEIPDELFLRALLVGYEVTLRLAAALQPGLKKRGFHATGLCGTLGAAAAAAAALQMSEAQLRAALSCAAASACGLLEMISDESQLKPVNAGKAAENGLEAVALAAAGFCGPRNPIGGARGFASAFSENWKAEWLDRNEIPYAITGIYRKPIMK